MIHDQVCPIGDEVKVTVLLDITGVKVTLHSANWATDQDVESPNSSSTNGHVLDLDQGHEPLHLERFIELVVQTGFDLLWFPFL